MFVAVQEHQSVAGLRKPGDPMPELMQADLPAITALVRSGAVVWKGEGGKFGPFTVAAEARIAQMDARLAARLAKIEPAQPRGPGSDLERLKGALEAEQKKSADLAAQNREMAASLAAVMARVSALESSGSAPAPAAAPSPAKGGR